ncbi:MAG: hypothetical protein IJ418_02020 [Clostridia bacterium]|nr:hypothetical protein [Clostridia bacterium]
MLKQETSVPDWEKARRVLHEKMMDYAMLGISGYVAIQTLALPLKRRYDRGERTEALYKEIMDLA